MITKKWDVFVYGDVNADIIIPGVNDFPPSGQESVVKTMDTCVGGGAALFALGLGKLGLSPVFQGVVGDDCYGKYILEEFKKNHVDHSLLTISEAEKTGISLSFTNTEDRSFLTYRGTNEKLDLDYVYFRSVKEARHIHITSYGGTKNHDKYLKLLRRVRAEGNITVSFDVGWDDTGEWNPGIYELFPYIDILFMNETEALHYGRKKSAKEAAKDFAKHCSLSVVKLGKEGALAVREDELVRVDSYQVKALDSTGAGDSFNAGFIYGFLKGCSVTDCLNYGNACGALSVTSYGGNTSFPSEQELHQFIREQKERKESR